MRLSPRQWARIAGLVASWPAIAAQPPGVATTVLGLPLQGRIDPGIRQCPDDSSKSKWSCWIDKPFVASSGAKLGTAYLPNPDRRPRWAAYALFHLTLDRDGRLDEIKVSTMDPAQKPEIATSISERFGRPDSSTLAEPDVGSATWSKPEVHIDLLCSRTQPCTVIFRSPKAQLELERQQAARRSVDLKRPISP